jgi:hypothetical protein
LKINLKNGSIQNSEKRWRRNVWFCRESYQQTIQRGSSNQKDEKEVLLLGGMHGTQRDQVTQEIESWINSEVERGN